MIAIQGSRRAIAGVGGAILLATLVVAGLALFGAPRGEKALATPEDSEIVAVLQTSRVSYSDDLRERVRLARSRPDDVSAAKRAARGLIDEGRAAGDTRLVGAGLGILRPYLTTRDAEALFLAATARQYQHDFTGALGLLDQAIEIAPNDAGSVLSRATITIVQGRFRLADADCQRLAALGRVDLSFLCQTTARLLTADAPEAYTRLAGIVAIEGMLDPGLQSYAISLMGEIAMLQGWSDRARDHFEAVLAADPGAIRDRMMLADLLLGENDDSGALVVLDGAPDVDGILLRRAIAFARLGEPDAAGARAELANRFRLNLDLGLTSHAREEARYFLQVAADPKLALERATLNWRLQRELEDAQLLIDAAVAAGDPGAAAPVIAWIADEMVAVPTLRIPDAVRDAAR